ncbi:hypothetical protein BJX65DRAFT_311730 [Aspergillus insuetus]
MAAVAEERVEKDGVGTQHMDTFEQLSPSPSREYMGWHFAGILLSVSFGFYAAILGTFPSWNLLSPISTTMPQVIGQDPPFRWAFPTLLLCQSASSLLFGRASDFVGRRWIFIGGNTLSFVGFIACSRAAESTTIVGLASLGTGIQLMGPFTALAELVPPQHRFTIVAISMALLAPLLAMVPAISLALVTETKEGWRWNYTLNAILSFASAALLSISYRAPTVPQHMLDHRPSTMPPKKAWIGLIVFVISCSVLTYSLLWGGNTFDALYGARFHTPGRSIFRAVRSIVQIHIAGQISLLLWFLPSAQQLVFTIIMGETGMKAAWHETSYYAGLAAGFILASIALVRPRGLKWHLAASVAVCMVFLCALAGINTANHETMLALSTLIGIGQGYAMVVSHVAAPMTAGKLNLGFVAGVIVGFRNLNYSVLNAILFAIFTPRFTDRLQTFVTQAALEGGLPASSLPALFEQIQVTMASGDPTGLLTVPGISLGVLEAVQEAVTRAATEAFRFIMLITEVYAIPLLVIAVLAPDTDMVLKPDDE